MAENGIQKRQELCMGRVAIRIKIGPDSNVVQLNKESFMAVHLVQLLQPIVY